MGKVKHERTRKYIAILILLSNIFFIRFTILNILTGGGKFGYGLLILPFTFSYHLFIVTALIELLRKRKSKLTLILNYIGLTWIIIGIIFIITMNF